MLRKGPLYIVALALVGLNLAFPHSAAGQTAPTKETSLGAISGKVTVQGKGVPGIMVGLRPADSGFPPSHYAKAVSDERGNYLFEGVALGSWFVKPFAPTRVVANYSSVSTGKLIVVAAGEKVDGVDFALVGGGVITGRVTNAAGFPLIEERINLIPADSPERPDGRHPSGSDSWPGVTTAEVNEPRVTQTDDRGIYRIFGLAAGRYKLSVGQTEQSGFVTPTRRAYLQTYYPDTTNPAKATVVELKEGDVVTNIDITVGRALRSFSANGLIVESDTGKPIPGRRWGVAKLTDSRDTNFNPSTYPSNAKGEFKVEGLLPGRYAVFVQPDSDSPAYSEPVQFEILDKDIDGLVLKTQTGATLSGKVQVDGIPDPAFLAKLSQMSLNVYVYSASTASPNWHSAPINPDGSFQVRGLQPGTASFNTVSSRDPSLVKNLLIVYTERYGIEQTRGLEIKGNETIDGLKVMVAYGTGVVRGEVKYENGPPPAGSRVVVRVTRTDKFAPLTGTDVDARGRFQVDRLPPGNYWLDLDVYLPHGRRGPSSTRRQVNIAGGVVEVSFTVDMTPSQP